jgi:hypothetical protein
MEHCTAHPGVPPCLQWQSCAGGVRHIRVFCPRCKRFLKFALQTPDNMAAAEPEPKKDETPDLFE